MSSDDIISHKITKKSFNVTDFIIFSILATLNDFSYILFELLICIIISHIYYLNDGYFGLFHPYYLYLILPIIFFVAKIVATVRLE